MERRIKLILCTALISFIFFFGQITPALGYIERYGFETLGSGISNSKVWCQADVVYVDDAQGGTTSYGLTVYANEEDRFEVKVYVTAYYRHKMRYVDYPGQPPQTWTHYYWDPIPENMIKWGSYEYEASGTRQWTWTAGYTVYGYSFSWSCTGDPTASEASKNSVSGDYRYIGWFRSSNSDEDHRFTALFKLAVDNDMARLYDNGKYWYEDFGGGRWQQNWLYIEKVRFKVIIYFKYYFFWSYYTRMTHTYIMGDGSPSGDMNWIGIEADLT
ncbi:MAG: hypothetical protein ACFFB2_06315 [Promethearchaeota archaeon]